MNLAATFTKNDIKDLPDPIGPGGLFISKN